VEKVADLRGRAYHHVKVEFASTVDSSEFSVIPGVTELEISGATISFKITGALDPVVKAASRYTVVDLEVTEPTLEEIFLGFYGRSAA